MKTTREHLSGWPSWLPKATPCVSAGKGQWKRARRLLARDDEASTTCAIVSGRGAVIGVVDLDGREAWVRGEHVQPRTPSVGHGELFDPIDAALKVAVEIPTLRYLWTSSDSITFVPQVCSKAFGDGRALLALSTINDRPRFYVLRIDSRWNVDDSTAPESADDLRDHLGDIYDALIEEFGDAIHEDDDGEEFMDEWPAFDSANGCQWSRMDWPEIRGLAVEPHAFVRWCSVLRANVGRRWRRRRVKLRSWLMRFEDWRSL